MSLQQLLTHHFFKSKRWKYPYIKINSNEDPVAATISRFSMPARAIERMRRRLFNKQLTGITIAGEMLLML